MLARLAHLTNHYRWAVIGAWAVLTLFGAFAAGRLERDARLHVEGLAVAPGERGLQLQGAKARLDPVGRAGDGLGEAEAARGGQRVVPDEREELVGLDDDGIAGAPLL